MAAPAADALPSVQSVHAVAPAAANVPAAHALHPELPFIGMLPAPHAVQAAWLDAKVPTLLKLPASQATQAPPDSF